MLHIMWVGTPEYEKLIKAFRAQLRNPLDHGDRASGIRWAISEHAVLGPDYHAILAANGVSHVYNYLYTMPSLEEQHRKLNSAFTAPFMLLRLLTPRDKKIMMP